MKNVFSDKIELKRLAVQRNLLWEYEAPIYQRIIQDRKNMVPSYASSPQYARVRSAQMVS